RVPRDDLGRVDARPGQLRGRRLRAHARHGVGAPARRVAQRVDHEGRRVHPPVALDRHLGRRVRHRAVHAVADAPAPARGPRPAEHPPGHQGRAPGRLREPVRLHHGVHQGVRADPGRLRRQRPRPPGRLAHLTALPRMANPGRRITASMRKDGVDQDPGRGGAAGKRAGVSAPTGGHATADSYRAPYFSQGKRSAKAGFSSSSQTALGSYWAKKGLPTRSASRHWMKCSANTFWPATSTTPSTQTFPGVADMDGPRTVRESPETFLYASLKMVYASASGTAK